MKPLIDMALELKVSDEIAPDDQIFRNSSQRDFYFFTGRSNIFTIYNILNVRRGYILSQSEPRRILDFGCGHGRTARYLRAAFPAARIDVTDLNADAVGWCVDHFGCHAVAGELPADTYDLVWAGSVFTHLPEHVASALISRLLRSLAPGGVLALTTHGRYRVAIMADFDWEHDKRAWMHFNMGKARFEQMLTGYHADGYGYIDYAGVVDYGMCIAKPAWYSARALTSNEFIQIMLLERADNRQDVSAFLRLNVTANAWAPLQLTRAS